MSFKPSDFFLSAIEFFGALVPGGIFLLIALDRLSESKLAVFSLAFLPERLEWLAALIAAFVVGQLLFALGLLLLDPLYDHKMNKWWDHLKPPKNAKGVGFNTAFSYLRLRSPEALGEVERQAGAYKLFRTLTVVFLAESVILALPLETPNYIAAVVSFLLALGCVFAFGYKRKWTEYLVLRFAGLVKLHGGPELPRDETGGSDSGSDQE